MYGLICFSFLRQLLRWEVYKSCFLKWAWGDAQHVVPGRCSEVCLLCSVFPHGDFSMSDATLMQLVQHSVALYCCQCPAWTSELRKAEVSSIQG